MSEDLAKGIMNELLEEFENLFDIHEKGIDGITAERMKEHDDIYFPAFFQVAGIKHIIRNKRGLIADEVGTGKTLQGIGVYQELRNRNPNTKAVIICPNTVKQHWVDEINTYCENPPRVWNLNDYTDEALASLPNSGIIIFNYDVFGRRDIAGRIISRLSGIDYRLTILDESHNIKSLSGLQANNVDKVARRSEYLAMLTGTDIPNTIMDVFRTISLLEINGNGEFIYPDPKAVAYAYWDKPDIVRAVFRRRRLKRLKEDVVKDLPPRPKPCPVKVDIDGFQRDIYRALFENNELEGHEKLLQLRKALLDPTLVNPDYIENASVKERLLKIQRDASDEIIAYKWLDTGGITEDEYRLLVTGDTRLTYSARLRELKKIVNERITHGKKCVIFSPLLRRGVTDYLKILFREYNPVVMDGTVDATKEMEWNGNERIWQRAYLIRKFNEDPNVMVFIGTTQVAGEGIGLTAGQCGIALDIPYTPRVWRQMPGRLHRRGQTENVEFLYLIASDESLVDTGVFKLLGKKELGIDFMEHGEKMTEDVAEAFGLGEGEYYKLEDIEKRMYTDNQMSRRLFLRMSGLNAGDTLRMLTRSNEKISQELAGYFHSKEWNYSYSAQTARLYGQIIQQLGIDGKMLDMCGAFGVLSTQTGRETDVVDICYHMLNEGKNDSNIPVNNYMQSNAAEMPLRNGLYDLVLFSLGPHQLAFEYIDKKKGKIQERERGFIEARRVAKDGAYLIAIEPEGVIENEIRYFDGIRTTGWEVIPEMSGFVMATYAEDEYGNPETSDYRVHVTVAKAIEPSGKPDSNAFKFAIDEERKAKGKKGTKTNTYPMVEPQICKEFAFYEPETVHTRTLHSAIASYNIKRLEQLAREHGSKNIPDDILSRLGYEKVIIYKKDKHATNGIAEDIVLRPVGKW